MIDNGKNEEEFVQNDAENNEGIEHEVIEHNVIEYEAWQEEANVESWSDHMLTLNQTYIC